jgi:8-oxo-dGTP diphosphatase
VVLLRGDGAALLQHRDDKPGLRHANLWVPPGGHCDPGESPLDCAHREFFEETTYRCDHLHHLTTVEDDPGHGWRPYRLHVFWAPYDGVQSYRCQEGQALEFVPRQQTARLAMPDFLPPIWDLAWTAFRRHCGTD